MKNCADLEKTKPARFRTGFVLEKFFLFLSSGCLVDANRYSFVVSQIYFHLVALVNLAFDYFQSQFV